MAEHRFAADRCSEKRSTGLVSNPTRLAWVSCDQFALRFVFNATHCVFTQLPTPLMAAIEIIRSMPIKTEYEERRTPRVVPDALEEICCHRVFPPNSKNHTPASAIYQRDNRTLSPSTFIAIRAQ